MTAAVRHFKPNADVKPQHLIVEAYSISNCKKKSRQSSCSNSNRYSIKAVIIDARAVDIILQSYCRLLLNVYHY